MGLEGQLHHIIIQGEAVMKSQHSSAAIRKRRSLRKGCEEGRNERIKCVRAKGACSPTIMGIAEPVGNYNSCWVMETKGKRVSDGMFTLG